MKYTTIIGAICLVIGLGLYFINEVENYLDALTGLLVGVGVGFLLGGFWGYISKKRKVVEKVVEKPVEIIPEEQDEKSSAHQTNSSIDLDEDIA